MSDVISVSEMGIEHYLAVLLVIVRDHVEGELADGFESRVRAF